LCITRSSRGGGPRTAKTKGRKRDNTVFGEKTVIVRKKGERSCRGVSDSIMKNAIEIICVFLFARELCKKVQRNCSVGNEGGGKLNINQRNEKYRLIERTNKKGEEKISSYLSVLKNKQRITQSEKPKSQQFEETVGKGGGLRKKTIDIACETLKQKNGGDVISTETRRGGGGMVRYQ